MGRNGRHTARCTSHVSVVLQCKLVSGWGLRKRRSAPPYRLLAWNWLYVFFTNTLFHFSDILLALSRCGGTVSLFFIKPKHCWLVCLRTAGGVVSSSWSSWSSCGDDCRRHRRRQCHVTPCDDLEHDLETGDCPSNLCPGSTSAQPRGDDQAPVDNQQQIST